MADPTQTPDSTSNGTSKTPDSQDTAPVATPKSPVVEEVDKAKKNQPNPKKTKKLEEHEDTSSFSSEDESGSSSSDESTDESTSPPGMVSSETSESESNEEQRRTTKSKTKRSRRRNQKKTKKSRTHRSSHSTTESDRSDNGSEDSSKDNQQLPGPQTGTLQGAQGAEPTDLILALAKRLAAMEAELIEARRNQNLIQCNHAGQSEESPQYEPRKSKKDKIKIGTKVEFKRVDQLWDNTIHDYKLSETVEKEETDEWDQYIFTVRRTFDDDNKHASTTVDIRSKPLREALAKVMGGVKGISLVEEKPSVDPNMLFLYLEETRQYMKAQKQLAKTEKKSKTRKSAATKAAHLKVLVKYLDTDYAEIKKALHAMLNSNTITFDLMWALFKPNTIAYASTYGNEDEPRAFKVDSVTKYSSIFDGESYRIKGRYLNYDGKHFGMVSMVEAIDAFKGSRKITSLECYPLHHHRDAEAVRVKLIERGRKFASLKGQNYKYHQGMAFCRKEQGVAKINVNGRVMVDPTTHSRINPNYPVDRIRRNQDDGGNANIVDDDDEDDEGPILISYECRLATDPNGKQYTVRVKVDKHGNEIQDETMDGLLTDPAERAFTDEEFTIASPVVRGFAFNEKMWLEFSVSGIREIDWNDKAFDSLVLPDNQKSIVKALVESHTYNEAQNIDDVIQGKGRGLVAVLHGPPGTGKTLTAEGIAELLKRPLYTVSMGELGINSRTLEKELNNILDIAHTWGAVLLLDEADIFLEKRGLHDIHRNALVSVFLRLLEYFQGILFLTTNRVETFDDAFQSRIHIALRYGDLTTKAKRSVWKMFLGKVQAVEGVQTADFTDKDLDALARHNMNGRQIKNSVRTAQALAVNEKSPLSMNHIKRVLEVAETFDRDLRGGPGYLDAMRSYT